MSYNVVAWDFAKINTLNFVPFTKDTCISIFYNDDLKNLQLLFTLSNVFSLVRPFTVSVSVKSIKYFCILFCYMPIAPGKDVDVFSRARALRWWRARNVACFLSWLASNGRSEVQKSLTHPGVTH